MNRSLVVTWDDNLSRLIGTVAPLQTANSEGKEGEDEAYKVLILSWASPTRNMLELRFILARRVLYTKEYKVKNCKQRRRRPYMAGAVQTLHTPPHVTGGACT